MVVRSTPLLSLSILPRRIQGDFANNCIDLCKDFGSHLIEYLNCLTILHYLFRT